MKHNHNTNNTKQRSEKCEECESNFNLRICTECGHTGCCDSQGQHARKHWEKTGHKVMKSAPVGNGFTWCYDCDDYIE